MDFLTFLDLIYLLRRIVDDLTFKTREDSVRRVAAGSESRFDEENSDLYRFDFMGRARAIHIPTLSPTSGGGRPGCAYIGCQAGICYMLAGIHDLAAMTSLALPTERLAGIFLGVLFTWTINLLVWPEDLLLKFSRNIRMAETKLVAIGEEIAATFRGSPRLKPVALDVTALQSTLQSLLTQVELSAEDGIPIRIWLKQLRLLAEESAGMGAVDADITEVLEKLNPEFVPLLVETLFLISLARSEEDFRRLYLRLEEREFRQIITDLHQGVGRSRPIDFKQRFAHVMIVCNRLLYCLRALTDAGSRFPAFLA